MNPVYIIIIMPFDLFGEGKYMYTFQNRCNENPDKELGDEAVRIFLNTKGKDSTGVSEELIQMLKYFENTNEVQDFANNSRLSRLQKNVRELQQNAEVGVKYLNLWEELVQMKREGIDIGRTEGINIGRTEGINIGRTEGQTKSLLDILEYKGNISEELKNYILSERNQEVLSKWIKLAVKKETVEEFAKEVGII